MNSFTTSKEANSKPANGNAPSELDNLIADIEEVLGRSASAMDVDVGRLRDSLRHKLATAKAGIAEGGRRITAAATSAATATDDYVRQSPWQAVGFAAAAGAAIGFLLARRSGDRG
jgi:ElaB/YqjD/DUF883 family membrane-anchored ribosome-binding protein